MTSDGPAGDAVFDAIKSKDLAALNAALDADPSVAAAHDGDGWSALAIAVMYGCSQRSQQTRPLVEALLASGLRYGATEASMLDDAAGLRPMLAGGADVEVVDQRGWTALHWACEVGSVECVKLLLEAGADPNASSRDGGPLERAAHPGPCKPKACSAAINLLKEAGATVTPAMAAMIGDLMTLQNLIAAAPQRVDERDGHDATPLWQAAHNLHLDCIEYLLARGADVNAMDDQGRSVTSTAVDHIWDNGGPEVVARLLAEDPALDFWTAARVDRVDIVRSALDVDRSLANAERWGCSVLYQACGAGAVEVVRLLLERGADPDFRRADIGDRPIHSAIWQKKHDVVQALIDGGADLEVRNGHGGTPLHSAIAANDLKLVELFLKHGADVSAINGRGHTALEMAAAMDRPEIEAKLTARPD